MTYYNLIFDEYIYIILLTMRDNNKFLKSRGLKILLMLLAIDFALLWLSWNFAFSIFYIDAEHNIPTIYQGSKLIIAAAILVGYFVFSRLIDKSRKFFLVMPLAFALFYLGVDEIGQIHENLPHYLNEFEFFNIQGILDSLKAGGYNSTDWLIIFFPAAILFIVYIALLVRKFLSEWKYRTILPILGTICFMFVFLVEYINTSGIELEQSYKLLLHLEEGLEMFGASFFMTFSMLLCRYVMVKLQGLLAK